MQWLLRIQDPVRLGSRLTSKGQLGLFGVPGHVRCQGQSIPYRLEDLDIRWLGLEHVERSEAGTSFTEGSNQGSRVDEGTAGGVHED